MGSLCYYVDISCMNTMAIFSMCAVREEQHELRFSPAMSNDDFLSYLKKEGLQDTDCSKLFGNDKTVNSSCRCITH